MKSQHWLTHFAVFRSVVSVFVKDMTSVGHPHARAGFTLKINQTTKPDSMGLRKRNLKVGLEGSGG